MFRHLIYKVGGDSSRNLNIRIINKYRKLVQKLQQEVFLDKMRDLLIPPHPPPKNPSSVYSLFYRYNHKEKSICKIIYENELCWICFLALELELAGKSVNKNFMIFSATYQVYTNLALQKAGSFLFSLGCDLHFYYTKQKAAIKSPQNIKLR